MFNFKRKKKFTTINMKEITAMEMQKLLMEKERLEIKMVDFLERNYGSGLTLNEAIERLNDDAKRMEELTLGEVSELMVMGSITNRYIEITNKLKEINADNK